MKQETRKKLSIILKILAIIVLVVTLIVILSDDKPTFADSGFSASYGGGSSSYSSSSSSSDDASGAGMLGGIILIVIFAIYCIIKSEDKKTAILKALKVFGIIGGIIALFPVLLILLVVVCKYDVGLYIMVTLLVLAFIAFLIYQIMMIVDRIRYGETMVDNSYKIYKKSIKQKQKFDLDEELNNAMPNFNKEEFLQIAFKIYKDVQIAWMNFDLDSVKNVITDEMYNMYEAQLATLKVRGEQNVMENMNLVSSVITEVTTENGIVTITVLSEIKQKDYIIENDTGKVLRGNKYVPMHMIYEMKYRMSIDENVKIENCPNCGAKLEDMNGAETCKYCGSKIVTENTKWVLTEKRVLAQKRTGILYRE